MFAWLLNLMYGLAVLLWSPSLLWQSWHGKRRSGWTERIWGANLQASYPSLVQPSAKPLIWLHAVSVGEVNLLVTLLPGLRQKYPEHQFAISASTDTGLALAYQRFPNDLVFRFPIDFSWAVQRIVTSLRPSMLLLTELEIWPNLLSHLKRQAIPVIVINGRLSNRSFQRYKYFGWMLSPIWRSLTLVLAQTEEYQQRFVELGVAENRCSVVGSIKFDAIRVERENTRTQEFRKWAGLNENQIVWLAGSTSAPEEEMAIEAYLQLKVQFPALRLIIVPRHLERFEEVALMCQGSNAKFRRRSVATESQTDDWEILLVDTIGELTDWWGVADIGFVGGSVGPRGGQSMIEPAGYGVAISFGPNTENFRDVVALLLQHEAAVVVRNIDELKRFVAQNCQDQTYRLGLGSRARQIAQAQAGATQKTLTLLENVKLRSE